MEGGDGLGGPPGNRCGDPAARLRGRALYPQGTMENEDRLPQEPQRPGPRPRHLPVGRRERLKRGRASRCGFLLSCRRRTAEEKMAHEMTLREFVAAAGA